MNDFSTPVPGWGIDPADSFGEVAGIAVAGDGDVYLFGRWPSRVEVRSAEGHLRTAFEADYSDRPHGLAVEGDRLYCVDAGASAVVVMDRRTGKVHNVLGAPGRHSDTGVEWSKPDTLSRLPTIVGGPPFNRPTDLAFAPDGSMVIADGYGNCRIHRMTPDGRLLASWGEPGTGPGEFNLPHAVAVDAAGRSYVADRENDRVQVFAGDGELVDIWDDVRLPSGIAAGPEGSILVAEVGKPAWRRSLAHPAPEPDWLPRVTVRGPNGEVRAEIGRRDGPLGEPGVLLAPHTVAVAPDGAVYVGELADAIAQARGHDGPLPAVQRFDCRW